VGVNKKIKIMENKQRSKIIPNTNYSIYVDGTLINNKTGKVVKFSRDTDGYMRVKIYTNGKIKSVSQHRILAEAFIPNTMGKKEVNHKNGNKQDNRLENLEWSTRSENMIHCYRELGRKPKSTKTKFVMNPFTGVIYSSVTEAASALGISQGHLSKMLRGFHNNYTNLILC
jgi:hypothetical protein